MTLAFFTTGQLNRGKLGDKPSTLKAGSSVNNKQVLGTLVRTGNLQIRGDVPEQLLRRVNVGAESNDCADRFQGVVRRKSSLGCGDTVCNWEV